MATESIIRKLRKEHQLTQQGLAKSAGVSFSLVSQVEGGKKTVRLDAINKILAVFGYEMTPVRVSSTLPKFKEVIEEVQPVAQSVTPPKKDWSFYD